MMIASRTFNIVEVKEADYSPKYHLHNFNDYQINACEINKKCLEIILGYKLPVDVGTCLIVENTKETRARINSIYDVSILDDNPIIMIEIKSKNIFSGMKPRW